MLTPILCLTVIPKRDHGNYYFTTLLDTTAYRAVEGVGNGMAMLQSGFTTVRDIGNAGNYADTALRQGVEDGWVQGPTIINAGIIIAPYGGQFHLQPEKKDLATPEYLFADTRDEMRKAIRQNLHFGAKFIKIVVDDQKYIMAFGTDVDIALPGETRGTLAIDYIQSWMDAGVPAADTLRAMTVNAARLLGVDKERGFLKPGMAADIIATPDNPVEDIRTLKRVSFVMKNGAIIKQ
jgi:imidazolonepropionase-like amidohydrolase